MSKNLTFDKLLEKSSKTEIESMLIQAIAALSTQPQFSSMTPWEIFEHIQNTAQEIDKL